MNLPHSDELEIQHLSRLFDNTSECYKFFWFQAIVTQAISGEQNISYEELIDEMIADAWYMVSEYHLNLGPKAILNGQALRFSALNGMQTVIHIQDDWYEYIVKNQEIIKGWLQYNMIVYLQRRNPSVPGIADKLYPPTERNLEKVKKYWRLIVKLHPIKEIYGHNEILTTDMSIDHFVPWSYVAHLSI